MSALNITIDPSIKNAWPEARLGCLTYTADVLAREDALWTCLENEVAPYLKTMLETTPLAQIPNLDESRKAYKAFGKDPGRFRVSSESLYRRVRQGKALYQINSVVDANNLVSLETGFLPRLLRHGPYRCGHRFPSGQSRGSVSGHRQGRHRP